MLPPFAMARYETYQSNAAEAPLMRKWILRALLISLALHAALFVTFKLKKLENFGTAEAVVSAPIPVNMKRVVIPKIDDKDTRLELPKAAPNVAKLQVPIDKPEVQEVRVAPQLQELSKPLQGEKPKVDMTGWEAMNRAAEKSRGDLDREMNSLAGALIKDNVRAPHQPVLKLPGGKPGDGGAGSAEGIPGLQSVSDLLDKTGSLKSGERGGIPGGALYEHDSADLKPVAITALQKLGELVKRNPNATFVIEGHTDATGSDDYNLDLSKRRAESVKQWLVANMGIAPERIETVGLGSTKLIVPGDKGIDEQQPNRRVEIVIKTNRK